MKNDECSQTDTEIGDLIKDYDSLHSRFSQSNLFQTCLRQALGDDFIETHGQYSFVGWNALNWVTEKLQRTGVVDVAVEIGCGSGDFAQYLVKALDCSLLATDFSSIAIEKALSKMHGGNVTFSVSDFNHLPVAANSLDALIGFDCVNHAKNYNLFCAELSRVMKKGGRVAFTNWMKDSPISELVKRDPLCYELKENNFQVDNILNLDPFLKRQFIFYDLIYQNRVVIRNDLGNDIFDSLMSEATHLYRFHGSVAHFAFIATYNP